MSKIKYKLEVYYSNSTQVRVSSEVERMGPETLPIGNSDWNTDKWNENARSPKLIRAIGDKKIFGFFTANSTANDYWRHRYKKDEQIDMVTIKIIGNGFVKKVSIFEVKVVPLSEIALPMGPTWIAMGYTLQFNDSNIDSSWSLSD